MSNKIRTLYVRPIRSADLSFGMDGVIGWRHVQLAQLGAQVQPLV